MPSKDEILVVQKATVYDLQKLVAEAVREKAEEGKQLTAEDFIILSDAYIKGAEQAK